jgi:hypothetical protein
LPDLVILARVENTREYFQVLLKSPGSPGRPVAPTGRTTQLSLIDPVCSSLDGRSA